jgi:hypothetical protein
MRSCGCFLYVALLISPLLLTGQSPSQCNPPVFKGQLTPATISAYMHGPYRDWCLAHGGTINAHGNCRRGPNFRCGSSSGDVSEHVVAPPAAPQAAPPVNSPGVSETTPAPAATQPSMDSFLTWLLNPEKGSAAQRREMMLELQRLQRQAVEQGQTEEAARLRFLYERLSALLKPSGGGSAPASVDGLKLKISGDGGGEEPATPAEASQGLQLKIGEEGGSSSASSATELRRLTPQQAADLVEAAAQLAPELQRQLMAAVPKTNNVPKPPAAEVSPATEPGADSVTPSSNEPVPAPGGGDKPAAPAAPPAADQPPVPAAEPGSQLPPPAEESQPAETPAVSPSPTVSAAANPQLQALSDAELGRQSCHAQSMLRQMRGDAASNPQKLDDWYSDMGRAKHDAFKESLHCVFDKEADGSADTLGGQLVKEMKQAAAAEQAGGAEFSAALARFTQAMREADERLGRSTRTKADRLQHVSEIMQGFYEMASKVDLSGFGRHGAGLRILTQCTAGLLLATREQGLLHEEISRANGPDGEKRQAGQSLVRFYQELLDESQRRGVHPGSCQ